jgi:hypothetical protein
MHTSKNMAMEKKRTAKIDRDEQAQIFISRDGQTYGPYSKEACGTFLSSGELFQDDLAWREGLDAWCPLGSLLGVPPKTPTSASPNPNRACHGAKVSAVRHRVKLKFPDKGQIEVFHRRVLHFNTDSTTP